MGIRDIWGRGGGGGVDETGFFLNGHVLRTCSSAVT